MLPGCQNVCNGMQPVAQKWPFGIIQRLFKEKMTIFPVSGFYLSPVGSKKVDIDFIMFIIKLNRLALNHLS